MAEGSYWHEEAHNKPKANRGLRSNPETASTWSLSDFSLHHSHLYGGLKTNALRMFAWKLTAPCNAT